MIDFIKSLRMPKIPGDTGGPVGATGSMVGLKRKRTEQQHEGEDEEDNEKTEGLDSKAKKKSATVSDVEPLASSVVPLQAPKPASSDRMAAFRRAKDAITQQHSALPKGPRVLLNTQAPSANQILRCSLHPAHPSILYPPKPGHPIKILPTT